MSDDKHTHDHDEENLSKGPTPETRRADNEPKREHDTSEGPTPETREAETREAERTS